MRQFLIVLILLFLGTIASSCKKDKDPVGCSPGAKTIRKISGKQAVIRLTATINPVWIIEQGAIDTKLIPCNLPMEYYLDGLQVVVSGDVKSAPLGTGPCCIENLVITSISR